MKPRTIILIAASFLLGAGTGVLLHDPLLSLRGKQKQARYVERHEGQSGLINPLLACDGAEAVLQSPDLVPFKGKIEQYLNSRLDKRWPTRVSVYFRELNDGHWISIGATERFVPASLRKVPLMIALLKQSEKDSGLLERQVTYDLANDYTANQNMKPAQALAVGTKYTVRELIRRMIVYSDNNAFTFLTKVVNPAELERVYETLRILHSGMGSDDAYLSVQTYESFFTVLYNASYLSKGASDWALATLASSDFKAGLVAGVPPDVRVAHKFGEKSDAASGTVQLHDCGIVYYPRHPYLLCIMSQGPNFEVLDDAIRDISKITFSEVDHQHRQH